MHTGAVARAPVEAIVLAAELTRRAVGAVDTHAARRHRRRRADRAARIHATRINAVHSNSAPLAACRALQAAAAGRARPHAALGLGTPDRVGGARLMPRAASAVRTEQATARDGLAAGGRALGGIGREAD
eukprot:scaffold52464_cov63-Phaeocystis_antarctica.AAC.2